jgi:succinate-semialdehyde dehydrogenase/glutarate-semialdehyde dehydrogenase
MAVGVEVGHDVVDRVPSGLYLGGAWREATDGSTLPVEDPGNGELLAEIADGRAEDALAALDAVDAVQGEWARRPPRERGEILRRAFEELIERQDELALLMTLEMGKPLAESRAEIACLSAGVLNVVTSASASRVVEPLLRDPRPRKVSFTGSTEVGKLLVEQGAERLLRMSTELGGNAPRLVFEDADLDRAVDGAMLAKMRNGGEACTAANRFLVHESVADAFTTRLAERMGSLRVGHGAQEGTDVGPLIDGRERDKVAALVEDARRSGAAVLCGGEPVDGPGYFYAPTVLAGVPDGARVLAEEIFGPVAPVRTFSSEEEAVAAANDTEYGLVAYLFTQDIDRALRVGDRLETGMLGLNQGIVSDPAAPFGGVKASGFGREGGREGIEEYLSTKYFAIATG